MLLYSQWLSLPINVRHRIAIDFGIAKKTPTHVQDNVIVSDGYDLKDIESALTVERISDYLGIENDDNLQSVWETLIQMHSEIAIHPDNVVHDVPVITISKKKGRPFGSKNKINEKETTE